MWASLRVSTCAGAMALLRSLMASYVSSKRACLAAAGWNGPANRSQRSKPARRALPLEAGHAPRELVSQEEYAAEKFRPDVVLLDIRLPKLNGYDACRRIREQPWGQNMVIVALTGWGQEEDRRRSKDAGF